ncbi:unnamed protein product [Lupinus luteus]|uniref:Uncharacterized protein n=1 Tax=Lupinus luteus TaxID=3873 RepID=A0AAV1XM46_LUPLU
MAAFKLKVPGFTYHMLSMKRRGSMKNKCFLARVKATNTIKLINTLIANSGSDPRAKSHYSACLTHFNNNNKGVLKHLDNIQHTLKMRDYYGVFQATTVFIVDVEDCIIKDDPTYFDKSNLPQSADIFERVLDIILTISKYLIRK